MMVEEEKAIAQAEVRNAFQAACGWWLLQADVRPATVMRFFEWAEAKWPWMRQDQEALLEQLRGAGDAGA